jgi:hypothetical protein
MQVSVVPSLRFNVLSSTQLAPAPQIPLEGSQKKPVEQSLFVVHLVLHVVVSHAYGWQFLVVAGGHMPVPSQGVSSVCTPSTQLAPRHLMSAPANALHAARSLPSHADALQASRPVPPPGQVPCLGGPATTVHVPFVSEPSHPSHGPVHASLQQRPSATMPLKQRRASVAGRPLISFGVHFLVVASQYAVAAHSESAAQSPAHAVPIALQVAGAHEVSVRLHTPLPSQIEVDALPIVHVGAPHATPATANARHAPLPLHMPSDLQEFGYPVSIAHRLRGSVSAGTLPQSPSAPLPFAAAVHASHGPPHADEQQTPSAQNPLSH